jgi:hypothetical protein
MAHANQIAFVKKNADLIQAPILVVGSKTYPYDQYNLHKVLQELGHTDIVGIDIEAGESVDAVVDIMDSQHVFFADRKNHFNTIFLMEVMTHVPNPFVGAANADALLSKGGHIFLSESIVRKISRMPLDLWRFTYDGHKQLFRHYRFYDERAAQGITRDKTGNSLRPLVLEQPFQLLHDRHEDESLLGYYWRGFHRKFFGKGIFKVSRLLPEQTYYAVAQK